MNDFDVVAVRIEHPCRMISIRATPWVGTSIQVSPAPTQKRVAKPIQGHTPVRESEIFRVRGRQAQIDNCHTEIWPTVGPGEETAQLT